MVVERGDEKKEAKLINSIFVLIKAPQIRMFIWGIQFASARRGWKKVIRRNLLSVKLGKTWLGERLDRPQHFHSALGENRGGRKTVSRDERSAKLNHFKTY
jgi:hypothetical protein